MPRELRWRRLGRHLDLPDGPAIASREVLTHSAMEPRYPSACATRVSVHPVVSWAKGPTSVIP
jgi:hypothetical protein